MYLMKSGSRKLFNQGWHGVFRSGYFNQARGLDSLIYSTALRANGDEQGEVIGAMGVLFDFQGEGQIILNDYMPQDRSGSILDGWFSFFTNADGRVLVLAMSILFPAVI